MSISESSFLIGNIIMTIGTLLLMRSVFKNKKALQGYDLIGSILTFVALLFLLNGFISSSQYASVVFALVTVSYWSFVVTFKLKTRHRRKEAEE
jgi:uncharacterized membrane protein